MPVAVPIPKQYIGEIEGLRAVAVIAVLLYHAGLRMAGGGFIGVDVFFVISGYLITGILLSEQNSGRLSLKRFYARRILRIAPALGVMLTATALIFYALFPPIMSGDLFASLASAALSYSNLWFYSNVDYFANNATNPVLHTWSLAVEEQFYFFFPLLLLVIGKLGYTKRTSTILACLLGLSLLASELVVAGSQAKAFYFPWLRAWELLAGSLLACWRPGLFADGIKTALSNLGLAAIIASCFWYDDKTVFPGYAALLPVLGSVAVISGAGSDSIANRTLRLGFMRWIGRISYSLYLVHWPIVCAASMSVSMNSNKVKAAVILVSFFFAWISWRFVEIPFRRMAGRVPERPVLIIFAVACASLLPYFLALQLANAQIWNMFPKAIEYSRFLRTDIAYFHTGTCFLTPRFDDVKYFNTAQCLDQNGPRKNVLVIGDSHAANIVDAIAVQHASLNILQVTAAGCTPTLDFAGPRYCKELISRIYLEWLPASGTKVEYVVIAARWSDGDLESLERTIAYLRKLEKRIIVYGPTSEYSVAVPLLLAYQNILGVDLGKQLFNQERRHLDAKFRSAISGGVTYFSPLENLCNASTCVLEENGVPLLFDRDHLTRSGATRAVRGFPLP